MSSRSLTRRAILVGLTGLLGVVLQPANDGASDLFKSSISREYQTAFRYGILLAVGLYLALLFFREKREEQAESDISGLPEPGVRRTLIDLILKATQQSFDKGLYKRARREFQLTARPLRMNDAAGTPIQVPIDVYYRAADGPLFIVGEPGVGKSTLLHELTTLLMPVEGDELSPVIVPFELNLWMPSREPLVDWIASDLHRRHQISRHVTRLWVANRTIIPFFDGLDEVPAVERQRALKEIAGFISKHPGCKTVVTCRRVEYAELSDCSECFRLIEIGSLRRADVEAYLEQYRDRFHSLLAAIEKNPALWELLTTPLLLWVAAFAFDSPSRASSVGTSEAKPSTERLFDLYLEKMLQREDEKRGRLSSRHSFGVDETMRQLSRIARGMNYAGRLSFEMEDLGPEFAPPRDQHRAARIVWGITAALYVAIWVGVWAHVLPFLYGSAQSITTHIFVSGFLALLISAADASPKPVDELRWNRREPIRVAAPVACLFGWIAYVHWTWMEGVGVFTALFVIGGTIAGLRSVSIRERISVYNGFYRSAQYSIFATLIGIVLVGIAAPIADTVGSTSVLAAYAVQYGVMGTLILPRQTGGGFVVRHLIIRLLLARYKTLPLRAITFLDFAVDRVIMSRQGGSYRFIHRMLHEHLAAKNV